MKKTVAFILSLALASSLSFSAFADAHSGTQTVTTTKSASTFSLTIPAATSIPWGTTYFELGDVIVKASSDFDFDSKSLELKCGDKEHHEFTSTTPGVTTTILYLISAGDHPLFFPTFRFGKKHGKIEADGSKSFKIPVRMTVFPIAWGRAQAGDYTTSVTYTVKVMDETWNL